MTYVFAILGMCLSVCIVKFREQIGDLMGEGDWMKYVGGVYNFILLVGLFVFFWSLATLTGTTAILFKPILLLFPGLTADHAQDVL